MSILPSNHFHSFELCTKIHTFPGHQFSISHLQLWSFIGAQTDLLIGINNTFSCQGSNDILLTYGKAQPNHPKKVTSQLCGLMVMISRSQFVELSPRWFRVRSSAQLDQLLPKKGEEVFFGFFVVLFIIRAERKT